MHTWKSVLTAVVILGLPVAMGGQGVLDLGDHGAAYAKKGENNGKGGGSGKSSKSEKSKGGKSEKSSRTKASKSGKSGGSTKADRTKSGKNPFVKIRSALSGKPTATERPEKKLSKRTGAVKTASVRRSAPEKTLKPMKRPAMAMAGGALASDLKSLNSLSRNINGMMNGKDAKMDPFRDFIIASAENEVAQEELERAIAALAMTQADYDEIAAAYELPEDPADALSALEALADAHIAPEEPMPPAETDPEYDDLYPKWLEAHSEWESEYETWKEENAKLTEAVATAKQLQSDSETLTAAEETATRTSEAASEEVMRQAMVDSLNSTGAGPVADEDLTQEMEDWVAARLGVDDHDGLIDDYRAIQATTDLDDTSAEDPEVLDEDDALEKEEDVEASEVALK
ncbi:hypothetical protein [Tropicimonas marinistellae]|uniref:hypothetical protein n=1 Tax=Tropicimonas marinistellae TaxID=1739787 RepID=UPI00082C7F88|nr:hypothetical protein [Tropicimonas marinistellae]